MNELDFTKTKIIYGSAQYKESVEQSTTFIL